MDNSANRKVFSACVVSFLAFMVCVAMWIATRSGPEDAVEHEEEATPSLYADGYRTGFEAFQAQMGIPAPNGPVLKATYTSSHEGDPEDFSRGYSDGYHRATELHYCPAGS